MNIFAFVLFGLVDLRTVRPSYLLGKRMALYDYVSIFVDSTKFQKRIGIHYPLLLTYLMHLSDLGFTPRLTYATLIILLELLKAMNTRQPFGPAMALLNGW